MIFILIGFVFFVLGTLFGDYLEEKKTLPISDQLDLAKRKGEIKNKQDVAFFTKMVIDELKKDLSNGYTTSYYSGTLWWEIKNESLAKEVSKNVSELTGLDFTAEQHPNNTYYIGCSDTTRKKES